MSDASDLIFISLEPWDDIWRRNQFVCAEWARRHAGGRVLFVTPPRDVSNALRRGKLGALRGRGVWSPAGLENVIVAAPTKMLPHTLAAGRAVNALLLRRHVRRMMRKLGLRRPVLWINDHAAGHLAGSVEASAVVYDITDDWTSSGQAAWLLELVRRQDEALCRAADAVIVCSQRLHEMKRAIVGDDRLHLIANGVDAAHYACVLDDTGALADEAAGWRKPVLGYTGTVHADRVDLGLVEQLARAFVQGSIVMIGPNHLPAADRDRLARCGNVHLTGPRAYQELPGLMRAFDVCIVPHRMTAFTESLNPIKLWEYLAAGKSIVATDVAGFRDYPQLVRLVRTPGEFVAAARHALEEGNEKAEARRCEARLHGWDRRVDEIERVIGSAVGRRGECASGLARAEVAGAV